jgi:hypothetical protein
MSPWPKHATTLQNMATICNINAQQLCAVQNVSLVQIVSTIKNVRVMKHAAMVETGRHH